MNALYRFDRPFTIDGVNPVRSPIDVLAPGSWSRATNATGADPATPAQRAAAYQLALTERCPSVPAAIRPSPDGVLSFVADTAQVDLVAESGAIVAELVPLTATANVP